MDSGLTEIATVLGAESRVTVDIRGEGEGAFLYVRTSLRAAEISRTSAGWWLELWGNADENPDDVPVDDLVASSAVDALTVARAWLLGGA